MTRKEKFAQLAKGFQGRHKNVKKLQILAVQRALQYQTRDRRKKKRYHRSLWAQQIGGGTKEHGVSYATFVNHLAEAKIMLNRKILAELAQYEPLTFRAIVEEVRSMMIVRRKQVLETIMDQAREKMARETLEREWNLHRDRCKKLDIEALVMEREQDIIAQTQAYDKGNAFAAAPETVAEKEPPTLRPQTAVVWVTASGWLSPPLCFMEATWDGVHMWIPF
eukprot:CAMPEP_0174283848 /NCGR_PEP_ID=MMETSP0809-20121228/4573_1 /TAXON_ID=73025 ORGANISM="Eutreptiella gymnastica-like, Strain CCMP1594" /NCGR_SAMPLE_ID=MMETSP0809 /ASSEMBLY_ACC=CAM_ASM_000658 /LENGTH=221 /DNA_ID=CAMNT_0015379031 /DNA_START=36 /DNA_END=700 /DNA_ORIENTATION=+